jgi:hypothetical protein
MPRYYFNVSNGDWQRDRKGLHLSGADQARAKAEDLADTIAATGPTYCGQFA